MRFATRPLMITIDLTNDDATFLGEQLANRCREVENELVHTDKRSLQAEIARDLERLERLHEQLVRTITLAKSPVAV